MKFVAWILVAGVCSLHAMMNEKFAHAIESSDYEEIKRLSASGEQASSFQESLISRGLDTSLSCAVQEGNFYQLKHTRACGGRIKDNENPLLCIAISNGFKNMVPFLIMHGASINQQDGYGNFPLDRAIQKCDEGLVRLLLALGANIRPCRNCFSPNFVQMAVIFAQASLVKLLIEEDAYLDKDYRLMSGDVYPRAAVVKAVGMEKLQWLQDVNGSMVSSLHLAVMLQKCDCVRLLVQYGINPDKELVLMHGYDERVVKMPTPREWVKSFEFGTRVWEIDLFKGADLPDKLLKSLKKGQGVDISIVTENKVS